MSTIEEKAKAYDKAAAKAIELFNSPRTCFDIDQLTEMFPELNESEDERIRKKLIGIFTNQSLCDVYNLKSEDVLAYLEKKKEQEKEDNDFVVYHPVKCNGEYECMPYSFYGSLTSFSENKELIEFLHTCFYTEEDCEEWIKKQKEKKQEFISVSEMVSKYRNTDEYDGDGNYKGKPVNCMIRAYEQGIRDILLKVKEQKPAMIQWTGKNLKEVIGFTGKSPKFGEWFKSWEDFENYVHSHGDILKLFCEDGSHYEVPVGAWIIKTPDGYNIPSRFKLIQKLVEWSEEEKACLNEAIETLNKLGYNGIADNLKHLRPQPKQEWNESTKNRILELVEYIKYKGREDDAEFLETLLRKK